MHHGLLLAENAADSKPYMHAKDRLRMPPSIMEGMSGWPSSCYLTITFTRPERRCCGSVADRLRKDRGLLGRGRGRGGLTSPEDRRKALVVLDATVAAGAQARDVAALLGVGLTTLQRWRRQFAGN